MAKKVEKKKASRSKKSSSNTTMIIIIVAFAVVIVGMIAITQLGQQKAVANVVVPTFGPKPQANGLSMGDPNAPVKVTEFADFQCPYCALYAQKIEPTVIQNYISTGQVYYTYSPFSFLGQESINAAEAAYCANDQGKFWEYRDMLVANHTGENVGDYTDARLIAFADKLNLDMSAFKECYNSKKYESKVNEDNKFADSQGVTGTPSFIVNGKLVGADTVIETINAALTQ